MFNPFKKKEEVVKTQQLSDDLVDSLRYTKGQIAGGSPANSYYASGTATKYMPGTITTTTSPYASTARVHPSEFYMLNDGRFVYITDREPFTKIVTIVDVLTMREDYVLLSSLEHSTKLTIKFKDIANKFLTMKESRD